MIWGTGCLSGIVLGMSMHFPQEPRAGQGQGVQEAGTTQLHPVPGLLSGAPSISELHEERTCSLRTGADRAFPDAQQLSEGQRSQLHDQPAGPQAGHPRGQPGKSARQISLVPEEHREADAPWRPASRSASAMRGTSSIDAVLTRWWKSRAGQGSRATHLRRTSAARELSVYSDVSTSSVRRGAPG